MSNYFENIPQITYQGAGSREPFAFKYYDPEKVIMGKKMKRLPSMFLMQRKERVQPER